MGFLNFSQFSPFLLITILSLLFAAESKTYWGDIKALKEFKNGLVPDSLSPGSCLSSWDFTLDPCDNLFTDRFTCGFRCDVLVSNTSRVTELSLDPAGYAGSLSSASWNLPYLETLDVSDNFFFGPIPDSFVNLTRLRRLGLSRNSFSGELPNSIGSLSSLEEIYLDNNNFNGRIPQSFDRLLSLKRIELQSNNFSGNFPELNSLKTLYFLDSSDNSISGEIPASLPISLIEISMRNNSLIGRIPEIFKDIGYLQVLDLSHNQLTNSIPSHLFEHQSLQQLTLSFNQLTSIQIPKSFNKSDLIVIDLSNNDLHGLLPSFMALMPRLSALSLQNNKFTGMIPTQYALKTIETGSGDSTLVRLLLGGNYLFGPIPYPILQLKPDSVNIKLDDNCLYRCPMSFFFCQGIQQKSLIECKNFGTVIP